MSKDFLEKLNELQQKQENQGKDYVGLIKDKNNSSLRSALKKDIDDGKDNEIFEDFIVALVDYYIEAGQIKDAEKYCKKLNKGNRELVDAKIFIKQLENGKQFKEENRNSFLIELKQLKNSEDFNSITNKKDFYEVYFKLNGIEKIIWEKDITKIVDIINDYPDKDEIVTFFLKKVEKEAENIPSDEKKFFIIASIEVIINSIKKGHDFSKINGNNDKNINVFKNFVKNISFNLKITPDLDEYKKLCEIFASVGDKSSTELLEKKLNNKDNEGKQDEFAKSFYEKGEYEKTGHDNIFPIIDKDGNYRKLDEIKELKGKTTVIYYDKNLNQMVAQPLEDFEKKSDQEKAGIVKQTNNIHVEGHRLGNSKDTRNQLKDFLIKGDEKTFTILPTIEFNTTPKETAEKEGDKVADFVLEDFIKRGYNGRIVLSGNSISNYTMVEIANCLDKKGLTKSIKTDLRINQPAKGGFLTIQVDESDLDINEQLFNNLNTISISNGKFDKGNGPTAFHKIDTFVKVTNKFFENFNEDKIDKDGAVVIAKLNGKILNKPLILKVENGETDYKGDFEKSTMEEQEISPGNLPEELKSKIDPKNGSNIKINKRSGEDFINFFGINKTGKEITVGYSLIENKITYTKEVYKDSFNKIEEDNKKIEINRIIKNEYKNEKWEHTVYLQYNNKIETLTLKKEDNKINIEITPSNNFELKVNTEGEIEFDNEEKKNQIEHFIEIDLLKNLLAKETSVEKLKQEQNRLLEEKQGFGNALVELDKQQNQILGEALTNSL